MSMTIENFDNYINQYNKILIHQLNYDPYAKPETNDKIQKSDDEPNEIKNIKFNNTGIPNNDMGNVGDMSNVGNVGNVGDMSDEDYKLYHLNISYLNSNNDWIGDNHYYSEHVQNDFVKHLKLRYLDNSNGLKKNKDKDKYKIISETCKIYLQTGIINQESSSYISTTLLNQSKLYDGLTNLYILTNPTTHIVTSVKIRTRAKDNVPINPIYRDILWDLELEEYDDGYRILGLDNFIHISLVGLEEIFLDIEYEIEGTMDLRLGWLKFDRCYYNCIIQANLATYLYENEESYSVDIIDWIVQEIIDINQQEQMYGNIFGTNYNILRILSEMGGIGYSN